MASYVNSNSVGPFVESPSVRYVDLESVYNSVCDEIKIGRRAA
jgi:hypothetical protein